MQSVSVMIELQIPFYDAEEGAAAERAAVDSGRVVYTWSTSGRSNWFSRGFHLADRLGYVLLPPGLADQIDGLDDGAE